jgi:hypothetical protein
VYYVKNKNSDQLKAALARGPVAVSVNSKDKMFKNYKGGIISNKNSPAQPCGTKTNHVVLAVGYGFDKE